MLLGTAALVGTSPGSSFGQVPEDSPSGVIRGQVEGRFQGGTRVLGFATVQASADGVTRTTPADRDGHYRLERLPAGPVVLRAFHPGHAPVELLVTVPAGGTVDVDLELSAKPIALDAVDVRSSRNRPEVPDPSRATPRTPSTGLAELDMQALDLAPGVGRQGLLDAVRSLPGNDPADASDILFMRGSTTDLKLVLLDGVPVYTPFHVAGLMRSFEPAVLGTAELHVGGAPARYDGGLTHILDLRTRTARRDRLRASGTVDLLTTSAAVESPLGDHAGILASGRSLHDLGRRALGGARPYGYRDLLVAVDGEVAPGHELGVTGFLNSEEVLLDHARVSDDARWSNRAATLSYGADLGGARLDLSLGASGYEAELPLRGTPTPEEPSPTSFVASGGTERLRAVGELTWGAPDAEMRVGTSHERIAAAFQAVTSPGHHTSENRGHAESTGAFFEGTRRLAAGVTLRAGLRADYFPDVGFRAAPRASFFWEIGPDALVTVAAGRYHQPTRTVDPAVEHTLVEMTDDGIEADEVLPVATADHVVLSLDQRIGNSAKLGLEGFFKRFEGLHRPERETVRSSGVDVRILSAGEHASGWLGYGLSWFWSGTDLAGRTADFSGRHLLTAGLSGRLAGPIAGEARISYGAGLPYTSIPVPTRQDSAPGFASAEPVATASRTAPVDPVVRGLDEEFLRLDLELHASLETTWGGRSWHIRPYVRILNALDQRDAMFYTFEPWRDEAVTPLAERPLLPLVGVSFSF
ncbi:MAG: TonB-dependent receptor [Gemmatimonadota bacterium]|nr:TonB-dependent receptor [Gemmatimonadota bacterium]